MLPSPAHLALVHGFTGRPESWDAVLEHLRGDFEVHRPSLLGHGPEPADGAASFTQEVDRLAGWLAERAEPPIVLAGYSMGGRVALGLLARHRPLFSAALLAGVHPGLDDAAERRDRARRDEDLARGLETRGVEAFVDAWQEQPLFASQARLPAAVLAGQRDLRLRHRAAGLARALRVLGAAAMPDYRPALAGLDLPVRLLAGALDDKFVAIARAMAARLPRAAVEIVPDAGHNLILEAPAAVAETLDRLAGRAAPQPRKKKP